MARRIHRRDRRCGVLLLLVLALLSMFALVAISFVVITGQAKRGAEAVSRAEQSEDPRIAESAHSPSNVLNEAIAQVIRGSSSSASALGPHDLLDDLHGGNTVYGRVQATVNGVVGNQLINLPIVNQFYSDEDLTNSITGDDPTYHLGSVLTMLDGLAQGKSARVVGAQSSPAGIQIVAFDGINPQAFINDCNNLIGAGQRVRFLLNGAPFGGEGQGYNRQSGQMNLMYTDAPGALDPRALWPIALLPRPFASLADYNQWRKGPDGTQGTADDPSAGLVNALAATQMNEDYDAPDYQTMILAMMLPSGQTPLPSLHRPELVNYWKTQFALHWNHPVLGRQLRRKIILRPLVEDHPGFGPVNSAFALPPNDPNYGPIAGPWDVDNDGDGIPDSIWIDLGMPARASKDGRVFKPLVAILCLDMDGRLNLNAHGSTAQMAAEFNQQASGPFAGTSAPNFQVTLPRGEGYGPADIRLSAVVLPNEVAQLLQGNAGAEIQGRYGEMGAAAPGPQAGVTNAWDAMARVKYFEFPDNSYLDPVPTSFGSPPDLWGRGAFGLDFAGQPWYWRPATYNGAPMDWWASEVVNNPYRINLSQKAVRRGSALGVTVDNPFTAGELERVLRDYDADAGKLPRRLLDLAPSLVNRRTEVTTDSVDVPCPPQSLPLSPELSSPGNRRGRGVADLLAQKLQAGGVPQAQIPQQVRLMLSWDLLANRRMDVNRPLGNARDSNSNGIVDEWQEATAEAGWFDIFPRNPGGPLGTTDGNNNGRIDAVTFWLTNAIDVNGDGNVDAADQPLARHLMARHLYVLGMLLAEIGYRPPSGPNDNLFYFPTPGEGGLDAGNNERRELTARRIAQWAINVVDFRDADAIMTPFEYDVNPFNGWDVNGDIDTFVNASGNLQNGVESLPNRRVVWGCEAPELLLTEAIAIHDRRVADTSYDSTGKQRTDDTDKDNVPDDVDLDQPLIPRGSAFFELYCPRNANNPVAPTDLYTLNGGRWYLDAGRLAPAGGPGNRQYPVWRIAISESRIVSANNDVLTRTRSTPHSSSIEPMQQTGTPGEQSKDGLSLLSGPTSANVQIDRIVWLASLAPMGGHLDRNRVYYNRTSATQIPCGGYAVVGPRFETRIGGLSGLANLGAPSPHAIRLDPVSVTDNDGTTTGYPDTNTTIQPPVSIVVAADPPNNWGANSPAADLDPTTSHGLSGSMRYGIGISISEPIPRLGAYYPEPQENNSRNGNLREAYCDVTTGTITGNPNIMDNPFDSDGVLSGSPTRPLGIDGLLRTQTTNNYKTVFLQRLADPGRPYQPDPTQPGHNPYVTVDWSPIDLTVFNGADRLPLTPIPGNNPWDSLEDGMTVADDNPNADNNMRFAARQRGGSTYVAGGANLWVWLSPDPPGTVNQNRSTLNFRHNLGWTTTTAPDPVDPAAEFGHTLGYVNRRYGAPWAPPPLLRQVYRGTPARPTASPTTLDVNPFPWLTWNNRQFASPLEVLLVPTSSAARLCWEFSIAANPNDLYRGTDPSGVTPVYGVPFGHLLNFFEGTRTDGLDSYAGAPNRPYFHRLLDFLEVPSRFAGTELVLNPQYAGRTDAWEQHLNRPPFNAISNFRDPGRVNINTVASAPVWAGLLNGHPGSTFDQLVQSRRGYGSGGNIEDMDPGYPTRFATPFRSGCSADLAPDVATLLKQRPVNATLLRASGADPDGNNTPLLADPSAIGDVCRDPNQNAYFRYQSPAQLGNLVTTRSNVFAVWITVGYFEVTPAYRPDLTVAQFQAIYPDGYWLGRELGSDTGEVKRHRAFYLIDRSIPVGFSRGRDYNVGNTILLNRFIE